MPYRDAIFCMFIFRDLNNVTWVRVEYLTLMRVCSTHIYRGIQLLEQDEVLFDYQQKVNIQETATAKGNLALETLEKDMGDLQLAINEEKRQIGLKKREVLLKRTLDEEITMLQIEVEDAQESCVLTC